MANDSLIRKIDLHGNVDLTNFHADIHDYEGFEKDNSLFLNKRKINWWKRYIGEGEIGGGLRGTVNGSYFDVYKHDSFLGKISRQYYKKEVVSSTDWQNETLSQITNPYPEGDNYIAAIPGAGLFDKTDSYFPRKLNNGWYALAHGKYIYLYNASGVLQKTITAPLLSGEEFKSLQIYIAEEDITFSTTASKTTIIFPGPGSVRADLNLKAGDILLMTYHEGSAWGQWGGNVYRTNLNGDFQGTLKLYSDGDLWGTKTVGHYAISSGTAESHSMYAFIQLAIIDNDIYLGVELEAYSGGYTQINKNNESIYYTTQANGGSVSRRNQFYMQQNSYSGRFHNYKFYINQDSVGIYNYDWILEPKNTVITMHNYSKTYGKWVINYSENKALNIAHNYKKLFELEGNEDASGILTDIDGYNDTYIYFHYGSDYYRISIQTATNFEDVVTSLNNVYYIFNTTSYHNAYYSAGNDWFCSCDDWNDRGVFVPETDEVDYCWVTSRLNNQWQNSNNVESVSDQMAPIQKYLSITVNTIEAFSVGATWDGITNVYDYEKNLVNDSLSVGDSLLGYYYATSYKTNPNNLQLYFIDSDYTCFSGLDENLETISPEYTVYFNEIDDLDTPQSLVQQGYISINGFTIQADSSNIFAIPDSVEDYQLIPCLLGVSYYVFTTSIVINMGAGAFIGMTSASLGGIWVLIYLNKTETDPLNLGDSVFVINGVEYTYRAKANRIIDYTGAWVCNTYLMKYIGYSTTCAYFYSEFDRAIYIFEGDNSLKKIAPLEKYTPQFRVYNDVGQVDTLNITSLNVVIVNLDTAFLVLFDNQIVVIECDTINQWSIDESRGTFIVNGVMYSLIKSKLAYGNYLENEISALPIEIETQLYGDPDNEKNIINDTVYLTVDNLMNLSTGAVTIQAIGLQNQKLLKTEEKTFYFKTEDFNGLSQCLIKYQPKLQECKGFKLKISSDFEIAELKIGTSQGAMNQTTKRI